MRTVVLSWLIAATCACAAAFPSAALAGFYNGNDLYERCDLGTATLYIMGALDADAWRTWALTPSAQYIEISPNMCIPDKATGKQVTDIVCNYLRDHPENRLWPATGIVNFAINEAWPCTP